MKRHWKALATAIVLIVACGAIETVCPIFSIAWGLVTEDSWWTTTDNQHHRPYWEKGPHPAFSFVTEERRKDAIALLRRDEILTITTAEAISLTASSPPLIGERPFLARALRDPDAEFTVRWDGVELDLVTWSGDDCFRKPAKAVRWPIVVWSTGAIARLSMESPYDCP